MIKESYINRAESLNFKLLEHNKTMLKLQCKEGHIFERNFANLLIYNECPQCKINNIKQNKYINIKKYVEDQNFILLSQEYVDQYTKLDLQCPNNHIFKKDYKTFKKEGIKCPECSRIYQKGFKKVAMPIKDVLNMFELEGYEVLDGINTYKNEQSKFTLKCNNDHVFTIDRHHFYHRNQRCPYCVNMYKLDINFCQKEFLKRDYVLVEDKYINSGTNMAYICKTHNNEIQYMCWDNFKQGKGCRLCAIESYSRENNFRWKGGITILSNYLRNFLNDWIFKSLKTNNFKCILTDIHTNDLEVHHLLSNNIIIMNVLNELNMPIYKHINEYEESDLKLIAELYVKYNYNMLGVPIRKNLHNLFHQCYGYGDNTPDQFEEFKMNYKTGKFDNFFNYK